MRLDTLDLPVPINRELLDAMASGAPPKGTPPSAPVGGDPKQAEFRALLALKAKAHPAVGKVVFSSPEDELARKPAPHPSEAIYATYPMQAGAAPSHTPAPAREADTADRLTAVLAERRKSHGDFANHAGCTQELKEVVAGWKAKADPTGCSPLNSRQQEALEMILHKIGRIVAGDPNHKDHWIDIAGYARLGEDACS